MSVAFRHGYEVIFFERQKLQQELYNAITDKSKFLTGRKVNSVEHREEEVEVKCENGEVYRGDVLLGADGTHSFVRSEMRKLIDEKDDKLLKGDKKSLCPPHRLIVWLWDKSLRLILNRPIRRVFLPLWYLYTDARH